MREKKKRDESMDSVSEVNNQRNEALFQISCCQFCFCMFMWFKEYFRGNDKEFIQ